MIAFETSIHIDRPVDEVFRYVSDPLNLPHWNSAVEEVRRTSAGSTDVGSTYALERQLPTGRAMNDLEIVVRDRPREFAIRTTAGPTPFLYRYRFALDDSKTVVQLDAQIDLLGVPTIMQQLARRAVKRGVDDNLATLKVTLEQRRVRHPE